MDPNENLLSVRVFGNGRWQTMKLEHVATGHYRIYMEERVAGVYGIKVKYEGVQMCNQKTQFFERACPLLCSALLLLMPQPRSPRTRLW